MTRAAALLSLCAALATGCDDADTVIAVWSPLQPDGGADAPDASLDAADEGATLDAGANLAAFYLEAEDGVLSGPLEIGASELASGAKFITATVAAEPADMPGEARAVYEFTLDAPADYVVWGRLHSPSATSNRFWVQMDDGSFYLWRISTGDAWFWDDVHDDTSYGVPLVFSLAAGAHRLTLANAVTGAELDRLYFTSLADHPPGNATPCNPPHSVELDGGCVRSCGSYVDVSCDPNLCQGREALAVYDCAICCLIE